MWSLLCGSARAFESHEALCTDQLTTPPALQRRHGGQLGKSGEPAEPCPSPSPMCQLLTEGSGLRCSGGRAGGHRLLHPTQDAGISCLPGSVDVSHAVLQISMNFTISHCAPHPCSLLARKHIVAQTSSSMGPASPALQSHVESPQTCPR